MDSEDLCDELDKLINFYSNNKEKQYLVLEEFIDHGIPQKRNPEYLIKICEYTKTKAERDALDELLELVRVGISIKLFTKLKGKVNPKLYFEMYGDEIVQRLKRIQIMINSGYIQPPGILFYDDEHHRIKFKDITLSRV